MAGARHRVAVLCWELIDELLMKGLLKAKVLIHAGPDDSIIATGTQLKKTCAAKHLKSEDGIIISYTAPPLVSLLFFIFISLTFLSVSLPLHINRVQVDQYQTIPLTCELTLTHSLWWFMLTWFLPMLQVVMALLVGSHQTKQIAWTRKALLLFNF